MKNTYQFISDPGHGWLRVSLDELRKLGIDKKISSSSYIKGEYAYLEEDCDAPLFIKAMKKINKIVRIDEIDLDDYSNIRNYMPYDPDIF